MKKKIIVVLSIVLFIVSITIRVSYGFKNNNSKIIYQDEFSFKVKKEEMKLDVEKIEYLWNLFKERFLTKKEVIEKKEEKETNKKAVKKNNTNTTKKIVENTATNNNPVKVEEEKKEEEKKEEVWNKSTHEILPEAKNHAASNKSIYNEVVAKVNEYRAEVNVGSISLDDNLSNAATIRAIEMAHTGVFSHTRPNGSKWHSIFSELSIPQGFAGENIAYNYSKSGAYVANQWKNSEGHYKNMINSNYNKIGIGMYKDPNSSRIYWVQLFTS